MKHLDHIFSLGLNIYESAMLRFFNVYTINILILK